MKRRRVLACIILCTLVLTACSNYGAKTYVLEEGNDGGSDAYLNIDRIYDYCYNISTYGNPDLAAQKTAFWTSYEDRRITINEYNNTDNTNYIKKVDFEFGFKVQTEGVTWERYDIPLAISPDGEYMFYEKRLSDVRYLLLYDYETKETMVVDRVDTKSVPPAFFKAVCSWTKDSQNIIFGWEYTGESQHVVALSRDYYYNNWRYGKENVYSIKRYQITVRELTTIYKMNDWKFHDKVFSYSLQISDNGYVLMYAPDDKWLYLINALKDDEHRVISKPVSYNDLFWIGDQGVYTQNQSLGIMFYSMEEDNWHEICSEVENEIDNLIASKNGNTLYFSVCRKSETYADQLNSYVWDILRYRVHQKGLEYMYQGVNDVIGLELSNDEKNLMLEMRDLTYRVRQNDAMLTRLFIFRSYTQDAEE